jgi:uncharacterized membrane protein (DUF2068 family)
MATLRRFVSRRMLYRAIAVFKFAKSGILIAAGIGAIRLAHKDISSYAWDLVIKYHLNPGSHLVMRSLERITGVTPKRLHELGAVAFIYAALFLVEGTGLWTLKRWGEWVTVVITGSLLPFEIYEMWHRPTLPKAVILILNAAIVAYLAFRLREGATEGDGEHE